MSKLFFVLGFFVCLTAFGQAWHFDGHVDVPKTTTEINAIVSPPEGMTQTNSTTGTKWLYINGQWEDTGSGIQSVVGGANINVDNTDPDNPIINAVNLVTTNTGQTISSTKTINADFLFQNGKLWLNPNTPPVNPNGTQYGFIDYYTNGNFSFSTDNTFTGYKNEFNFTGNTDDREYTFPDFPVDFGNLTQASLGTNSVGTDQIQANAVTTTEIADNTIGEVDLNVTNAPTDGDVMTYNSAGTNFTWMNLDNYVDLTSTQTITAVKTFSTGLVSSQIEMDQGVNQFRPTTNGDKILFVGGNGLGDRDWSSIHFYTSSDTFRHNNVDIAHSASGTFTPTLVDNGGGATYTFSNDYAKYSRVEDQVFFSISLTNINTTGTPTGDFYIDISDIPYSIETPGGSHSFSLGNILGGNVNFYWVSPISIIGDRIRFQIQTSLDSSNNTVMNSVTFTSGTIRLSGTYITSDPF